MASASTSDHQPMPMQATRSGSFAMSATSLVSIFQVAPIASTASCAMLQVGRPVAAADADAADAFAVDQDRARRLPSRSSAPARRRAPARARGRRRGPGRPRPSARWRACWTRRRPPWWSRNARCGSARRPCARARSDVRRRRRWRRRSRCLAFARLGDARSPSSSWRRRGSGAWCRRCTWGPAVWGIDVEIVRRPVGAGKADERPLPALLIHRNAAGRAMA